MYYPMLPHGGHSDSQPILVACIVKSGVFYSKESKLGNDCVSPNTVGQISSIVSQSLGHARAINSVG